MPHPQIARYKPLEIIIPERRLGLAGIFRMEAFQCWEMADGRSVEIPGTRRLLAEFTNQITNLGLDHIGEANGYGGFCQVGEGNAAENVADTALDDYTASQGADPGWLFVSGAQATPPYYGWNQRKYRFLPNFAGGAVNISEVGIGPQSATGNLFSRALVKDSEGDPTTVGVAATEYLDVYYTLRNYPDHVNYTTGALDDGEGTISAGLTNHDYTIRAALITAKNFWGVNLFVGFGLPSYFGINNQGIAYSGDCALGAVTSNPTASETDQLTGGGASVATYGTSSYANTINYEWALDEGNFATDIGGFLVPSSISAYQILFDTVVEKDNTQVLTYAQRTTWFRKAL